MEYPLPQFLQIKPKVAGPFNFRQLAYIVSGCAIPAIIYFTSHSLLKFFLIGIPTITIALIFAFGKIKGFPVPTIIARSFFFIFAGKKYIWKKIEAPAPTMPQTKKMEEKKAAAPIGTGLKIAEKSRLKEISKLIEIHPK